MAEFCYDCYKKILKGKKGKDELIISKTPELCEGCAEYKEIVVCEKSKNYGLLNRFIWLFLK